VTQSRLFPGNLDPAFSDDGRLRVGEVIPAFDADYSVRVQADDKVVTLSAVIDDSETSRLILHRFNPDSSPDLTFGEEGSVASSFDNCCALTGRLVIQADGKIVVVAETANGQAATLLRYHPDGNPDTTFEVPPTIKPDGYYTIFTAVVALPAGKILLAGPTTAASAPAGFLNYGIALVRLNANGALDNGFGNGGRAVDLFKETDPAEPFRGEDIYDAVMQGDGKIMVTSRGGSIRRYSANGSLEKVFVVPETEECDACWKRVNALGVQTDDKIVAAGVFFSENSPVNSYFYLARFNPDGTPDQTFDGDGQVWTDLGNDYSDYISDVVIQTDGKIIVAGASGGGFALGRYQTNGSLDESFGDMGTVITTADGETTIHSTDLTGDGKLMAIGTTESAPGTLVRYALDYPEPEPGPDPAKLNYVWLPMVYMK